MLCCKFEPLLLCYHGSSVVKSALPGLQSVFGVKSHPELFFVLWKITCPQCSSIALPLPSLVDVWFAGLCMHGYS